MTAVFTRHRADTYIHTYRDTVDATFRPNFHLTAEIGWMNDPNGFVQFRGEYHLFYQTYPYGSEWGAMHWGHAVSRDLLHWEYLPIALAPDMPYDKNGCFSGSALVVGDTLWLMYTGNTTDAEGRGRQVQNMAYSTDGVTFTKWAGNPVLTEEHLPDGVKPSDFRDPKLFEKNGRYYSVVAAEHRDGVGCVLLFSSDNLTEWNFVSVFLKGTSEQGIMWECPDYMEIEGQSFLILSPMRYPASGYDYANLNSTIVLCGQVDWEKGKFDVETIRELDHGQDFYAAQSLVDDAGRRLTVAWMQMWERRFPTHEKQHHWAGGMTLPRQLKWINHHLYQVLPEEVTSLLPRVELEDRTKTHGLVTLPVDGTVCYRLGTAEDCLYFGYDTVCQTVYLDRRGLKLHLGGSEAVETSLRQVRVSADTLTVVIDCNSIEIFVNNGQESLSATFYIEADYWLERVEPRDLLKARSV